MFAEHEHTFSIDYIVTHSIIDSAYHTISIDLSKLLNGWHCYYNCFFLFTIITIIAIITIIFLFSINPRTLCIIIITINIRNTMFQPLQSGGCFQESHLETNGIKRKIRYSTIINYCVYFVYILHDRKWNELINYDVSKKKYLLNNQTTISYTRAYFLLVLLHL